MTSGAQKEEEKKKEELAFGTDLQTCAKEQMISGQTQAAETLNDSVDLSEDGNWGQSGEPEQKPIAEAPE